ncbi:RNA polymerase sigma-70 factor [Rhodocytophaga aerolata]|uniref:RNA polymerase sigma-70 factor n=1 Tax=Rhodocytophaga aerolata TaxID=455078 RepID=A0ABT8RHC1_9BACT|nr:RNA polymerase sigma-70 factor [Rhodocytophaga aerolata]MDO1451384.1 RNA polymerase sigma-70 factor [Rhodocytophaga aerolata]
MHKNINLFKEDNRKTSPFMLGSESENKDDTFFDNERFIRKTFEDDPEKGFELLFKAYYRPLCSHAARYVYSKELAEDLVGEVFEKFFKKQLHLQVITSFQAYLFTAVRHQAFQHLRTEFSRKKVVPLGEHDINCPVLTPHQLLQYDELYLEIEKTIHLLSPPVQRVFLMSRFEGKKNAVIAEELQISIKTVEAHITKVLKLLHKVLQHQLTTVLAVLLYFLSSR